MYSFALKACGDIDLAAEITQDVFVRLWTTKAVYRKELSKFSTWLLTITRRIYQDKLRKKIVSSSKVVRLHEATDENKNVPLNDSERIAAQHWFRDDVSHALLHLRVDDRRIIELAYFQGMTLSEIAHQLEQPIGTVKTRLHRGLKALRDTLAEWQGGLER